jgi:hypothetical protein
LVEFEKALQDAHETLYGDRNIGLPFWDWGTELWANSEIGGLTYQEIFHPELKGLLDSLGEKPRVQSLFGNVRPTDKHQGKTFDKGWKMVKDSQVWGSDVWTNTHIQMQKYNLMLAESCNPNSGFFADAFKVIIKALESMHNCAHMAGKRPMNSLATASYHLLFYLHHSEVDRLFQQYVGYKAYLEQALGGVENDYKTQDPHNFDFPLEPFKKADGSTWTSEGLLGDTRALGYYYGSPHAVRPVEGKTSTATNLTIADPSSKHHEMVRALELQRDTPMSIMSGAGLSVMQMVQQQEVLRQTVNTRTKYLVELTFGKDVGCKLELQEQSFFAHFFLTPKSGPPLDPMPTNIDQLESVTSYVGMAVMFGGANDGRKTHSALLEILLELDSPPESYDVTVLYERGRPRDEGALMAVPTFWKTTAACEGNKPVPDASWVHFKIIASPS